MVLSVIAYALNSITGRKALSARGGHATARVWRAQGWYHQKRITHIAAANRSRKAMIRELARLDGSCFFRLFGCSLLVLIQMMRLDLIDEKGNLREFPGEGDGTGARFKE